MNSLSIIAKIQLYKILIQEISTIFIDLMSTCIFPKKVHFMLASKFSTVYHLV